LEHTTLNTALVDRIVGRGRSAFGTGGGRAATCGEDASDESDSAVGTTTGGESLRGCFAVGLVCTAGVRWGCELKADIIARRCLVAARIEWTTLRPERRWATEDSIWTSEGEVFSGLHRREHDKTDILTLAWSTYM